MNEERKPDPQKRKIIIKAGRNQEEIEVGLDVCKITIFKLGSESAPATREEFDIFIEHLRKSLEDPNYIIMWNHRIEVLQPEL